jgi:hypothetical protein
LQEQTFYSEKMSKWKSEVASAITDVFFIKMVEVPKMLRTTTSHYMNSLSVVFSEEHLDEHGGALAALIDGQAQKNCQ